MLAAAKAPHWAARDDSDRAGVRRPSVEWVSLAPSTRAGVSRGPMVENFGNHSRATRAIGRNVNQIARAVNQQPSRHSSTPTSAACAGTPLRNVFRSSGRAIIIGHAAESLAPSDRAAPVCERAVVLQQPITETLMIALTMIVRHVMGQRALKRGPAEEDHSIEALSLHRANESLRVSIKFGERGADGLS